MFKCLAVFLLLFMCENLTVASSFENYGGAQLNKKPSKSKNSKVFKVNSKILKFTEGAMHDHILEGVDIFFASVLLEIIKPNDFPKKELEVFVTMPIHKNALWRKLGKEVCFEISKAVLKSPHIFSDSITILVKCNDQH